jgi:hypothetical protein
MLDGGANKSSVQVFILMERIPTSLVIAFYTPMTLLTWVAFASFELRPEHGTDRVGFLVTLLLIMVPMTACISISSPGGNIVTSIGTQ